MHHFGIHVRCLLAIPLLVIAEGVSHGVTTLLPWQRPLAAMKRRAELEYPALVAKHGRLVRARWIPGEKIGDEPILSAPEIGPVADTAIPLVFVLAIEIP